MLLVRLLDDASSAVTVGPHCVAGFLGVLAGGAWDPTLLVIMAASLLVALPGFQWALQRTAAPLCGISYELPNRTDVDKNLVLGAALFGAGWGE
jgi:hypothetical protein